VAGGLALVLTIVPIVVVLFMVGPMPLLLAPGLCFTGLFTWLIVTAVMRARASGTEIGPAIDGAWVAAATDLMRQSRDPLSAQELSQKLGIEEPQAEELLALMDVNEAIGSASVRGLRRRIDAEPVASESAAAIAQIAEAEAVPGVEAGAQRKKL
jgi:hypothetical protein